jgi:hypothetical protein
LGAFNGKELFLKQSVAILATCIQSGLILCRLAYQGFKNFDSSAKTCDFLSIEIVKTAL